MANWLRSIGKTLRYGLRARGDKQDGCAIDFADPATVSTDDQSLALVLFGDLDWVGERIDTDGRTVPVADPLQVAARIDELRGLTSA